MKKLLQIWWRIMEMRTRIRKYQIGNLTWVIGAPISRRQIIMTPILWLISLSLTASLTSFSQIRRLSLKIKSIHCKTKWEFNRAHKVTRKIVRLTRAQTKRSLHKSKTFSLRLNKTSTKYMSIINWSRATGFQFQMVWRMQLVWNRTERYSHGA